MTFDRYRPWLLLVLALLVAALGLVCYRGAFDHDEFEAMHTAWKLWRGELIYIDFIQHHFPALHYGLVPLYSLFGADVGTILVARMLVFAMLVGTLAATWLLAREMYPGQRGVALAAVLILASTTLFTTKMVEIRPDTPQVLALVLGSWLAFRGFRTGRGRDFVLGGLAFGVAILFLQKAVVVLAPIGLMMLWRAWRGSVRWSDVARFTAAGLAPPMLYLVYFGLQGRLADFWFFNVTFNATYYELRGWEFFKLRRNIYDFLSGDAVVALLLLIAVFVLPKRRSDWEALAVASFVLAFAMVTGRHNLQYYTAAFPFAALLCARALTLVPVPVAAVVLLFVGGTTFREYVTVSRGASAETQQRQFAIIRYVTDLTPPDEPVYDGRIDFNVFRSDVDFIWYMAGPPYKAVETMAMLRDYEYDLMERIRTLRPTVVYDYALPDDLPAWFEADYRRSERFEFLFIRSDLDADPAPDPDAALGPAATPPTALRAGR